MIPHENLFRMVWYPHKFVWSGMITRIIMFRGVWYQQKFMEGCYTPQTYVQRGMIHKEIYGGLLYSADICSRGYDTPQTFVQGVWYPADICLEGYDTSLTFLWPCRNMSKSFERLTVPLNGYFSRIVCMQKLHYQRPKGSILGSSDFLSWQCFMYFWIGKRSKTVLEKAFSLFFGVSIFFRFLWW